MSQSSISRKFRPQTFAQYLGQDAVKQVLIHAMTMKRVAHAYLFCGPRGTGKTSLARIFAKSLNCTNKADHMEPCNQCNNCKEITQSSSLDVLEIDGASHRGIEEVRKISHSLHFVPGHSLYKIVIIDEAHMLTKEAWNALLKILEEPPEHVKFFFATTEAHKLPATIISRCQRLELKRMSPKNMQDKLQKILTQMDASCSPAALSILMELGDGSMRDTESMLEQMLAFTKNNIQVEDLEEVFGIHPQKQFQQLDQAFAKGSLSYAFDLSAQLYEKGKNFQYFLEKLHSHYRYLLLSQVYPQSRDLEKLDAEYKKTVLQAQSIYTKDQLLRILELLTKYTQGKEFSISSKSSLELLLLSLLQIKESASVETLLGSLASLKEELMEAPQITNTKHFEKKSRENNSLENSKASAKAQEAKAPCASKKKEVISQDLLSNAVSGEKKIESQEAKKSQAHYDTLFQFASVELEGNLKIKKTLHQ